MSRLLIACVLVFSLAAGGCGTTTIVTNDTQSRIIVDGQLLGRGQVSVNKRGTFGDQQVLVKTTDGRQKIQQISRSFTVVTLLLGVMTYGICLFACWEYPDSVFVMIDHPSQSDWGSPGAAVDPWMAPPPGWTEPKKAP